MSFPSYSGGKGSRVGAGQASSGAGIGAMYQFSSPEALALGIRLPNAYWGMGTVLAAGTSIAVVFNEPRADADYAVFATFAEDPGAAVAAFAANKTALGFDLTVDAAPGADTDIHWLAFG